MQKMVSQRTRKAKIEAYFEIEIVDDKYHIIDYQPAIMLL